MADIAPEKVLITSPPADGCKAGWRFVLDPATGTLVVSPDFDLKIRKAIMREVSRIKRRLFFQKLRLQIEYFALQVRCTALKIARNATSYFLDCCGR